jgi:integrase
MPKAPAANKAKITKEAVDALQPGKVAVYLWDTEISGFGVKVTPAGHRSYILQYRMGGRDAPTRRFKLGDHGKVTPDAARKMAAQKKLLVTSGKDPMEELRRDRKEEIEAHSTAMEAERAARRLLVSTLVDEWVDAMTALVGTDDGPRPRTVEFYSSTARKHIIPAIGDKPLPEVTKAEFRAMIKAIPAGSQALRRSVHATMSALCGWARKDELIGNEPLLLEGVEAPKPVKARDRWLSQEELAIVWQASHALRPVHRVFYRLLILTGQRREEVAGLQWSELDRAAALWTLPAERAKNGRLHLVPLSPLAVAQLDAIAGSQWPRSGPVLSLDGKRSIGGFSKLRKELDEAIDNIMADMPNPPAFPAWRVHDLRRTLATGMQQLGVRFEVTEAILNHVSGSKAGIAAVYQWHDWAAEKRDALNKWAEERISPIISTPAPARPVDNVIPLRRKRGG